MGIRSSRHVEAPSSELMSDVALSAVRRRHMSLHTSIVTPGGSSSKNALHRLEAVGSVIPAVSYRRENGIV